MIRVDLSRVVQPRLGIYLLGLIPGVFFESSIVIGSPAFAASVISRLHQIYSFGPYALFLLFLTSSWFIGSGFFYAAWITARLVFYAFVLSRYVILIAFGSQWLYQRLGTLQGVSPKQTFLIRWLSKLVVWARLRKYSNFEARPVLKCLHRATKQLLKEGYGIEISSQSDGSDWNVWYSVLGKPPRGIQEAVLASRTVLGCGLAGFTALYASPMLRERYFIGLCCIFAFLGLFSSLDVALWNSDPVRQSLLRLKSILLELSEVTTQKADSEKQPRVTADVNRDD